MDTNEQERVRAAVRESYGKIARDNGANAETTRLIAVAVADRRR